MKRSLLATTLLLIGVLSLPVMTLSAAQLKNDSSSLIAKGDEIHHKWFLRFDLVRPQVRINNVVTPLFGHVRVALRDPEGELVFHRVYSFETLPSLASAQAPGGMPFTQTIKIHKPIKGLYTFFVTLLDRNMDSGAFDPTTFTGQSSNYIFTSRTNPIVVFDEHNTILLDTSDSSTTPFIPNAGDISKPTDPKVTGEQTFSLQLP